MLDANVLISGTVWPRFPYEILRHAIAEDFQLVLSPFIIAEAQKHLLTSFPENAPHLRAVLELSGYEAVDDPLPDLVANNRGLVRDVNDVPVALAAIKAKVDYLVTSDKDFTDPNEPIRNQLNVRLPGSFLREFMGWTSEQLEAISHRNWENMAE